MQGRLCGYTDGDVKLWRRSKRIACRMAAAASGGRDDRAGLVGHTAPALARLPSVDAPVAAGVLMSCNALVKLVWLFRATS